MKKLLKYSLLSLCICASGFTAVAQIQILPLYSVKLKNGTFKNAQDVDLTYILALKTDKLLAPYLIDAGLLLKADRYGNWGSSSLDRHIGGLYLLVLTIMYASLKTKS